jgi:hypothetical protein
MMTKRTAPCILHPVVMLVTPIGVLIALAFLSDVAELPTSGLVWGMPVGIAFGWPVVRLWQRHVSSLDPAQFSQWTLDWSFGSLELRFVPMGLWLLQCYCIVGVGKLLALPQDSTVGALLGATAGLAITWSVGQLIWWRRLPPE